MQGSKLWYFDVLKSFLWVIRFPLVFAYNDADPRQQNNFKDSSVRADKKDVYKRQLRWQARHGVPSVV